VPHAHLRLCFPLDVNLGWLPDERQRKQHVSIELQLRFATPPRGCDTDELADTWCYDTLAVKLRDFLSPRHFRLLEHLTAASYHCLRTELPADAKLLISITKTPQLTDFTEAASATFSYGDDL
jgi:dihydroneopterin aldolase